MMTAIANWLARRTWKSAQARSIGYMDVAMLAMMQSEFARKGGYERDAAFLRRVSLELFECGKAETYNDMLPRLRALNAQYEAGEVS